MALTTSKRFNKTATSDKAVFWNDSGQATQNIEGIVEIAGLSDINVDVTSVNAGSVLIGKSTEGTGEDFSVAYLSATTLTLGAYPTGITGLSSTDIEFVRHIDDSTGVVVATYSRDDSGITAWDITGNTLTMTGAAFTTADDFVIGTNISRDRLVPDLEISSNCYVGKITGGNGDFDVSYDSSTTIDVDTFPAGITAFVAEDIELIRQVNTSGVWVADHTAVNSTITMAGTRITIAEAVLVNTDTFVLYTNVSKPSAGSSGVDADYKIGSWDGTVTYASTTTVTLAGSYPTINYNSQVSYIKYTDDTLNTSDIFINGQDGITLEHSGGTLTIYGAATPFAVTNDYEVGINATPISLDIDSDTTKTTEQAPDYGHYTDVEQIISQTNLGITGTATAGDNNTLTDTGAAWDEEDVAVGYDAYTETDDETVAVNSVTDGTNIETANLAGTWTGDVYWLPECERYEISAESYNYISIHTRLATTDADNAAYIKIYASNDSTADTTDDTYWVDISNEVFGVAQLTCSGATGTQEGIYFIDQPTVVLKYMLKIVGEVTGGAGAAVAAQVFNCYVKKGY